ncbi:MAG: conserved rane protein of unknown function [Candidatus Saccharibacteria bacterium]|nr:conserved rane protein of unknown function [Candidatus Saccharibacteria bacterium]
MKHKKIKALLKLPYHLMAVAIGTTVVTLLLFCYKLGTLTPSLSPSELLVSHTPIGWSGLAHDPLYLPLLALRSVALFFTGVPGEFVTRLPNVVIGVGTVLCLGFVLYYYHGLRIASMATALFALSAWTLHVSRYASNDVLFLAVIPFLLATQAALLQGAKRLSVVCLTLFGWGLALYIPGGIWLVLVTLWWQKKSLKIVLKIHASKKRRVAMAVSTLISLPLLIIGFVQQPALLKTWIGLPAHLDSLSHIGRNLLGIPVHLFIRGPEYPTLWLGRLPILDTISLVLAGLGIYYYGRNWKAARSRILISYALVGTLLVGLGGPVAFSLLVPLLYVSAAAGAHWLLRDWLRTFPINPFARAAGISLLTLAIAVSCFYNLRSYFVAWPNNDVTKASFRSDP